MTVTTPVARRAQQPIQRRIEADLAVDLIDMDTGEKGTFRIQAGTITI
jgi:hypothetical protein